LEASARITLLEERYGSSAWMKRSSSCRLPHLFMIGYCLSKPQKMKQLKLIPQFAALIALFSLPPAVHATTSKKVLVVTTTTGYRHASIPNLEKVLTQLGQTSGEFTVELIQQPPGKPDKLKKDATAEEKEAYKMDEDKWDQSLKVALQKLSPESLKNYDAVIFASTSGNLPLPDKQGFLDWIKAGHAFIGIHAASDTFHKSPEFIAMLGGEFGHHGPQVGVECLNEDAKHPANEQLGKTWAITQEEMYQFKTFDPTKVHGLLALDKNPETGVVGHYPVSWCKPYGNGRVFYTSLGHREDIIDADPNVKDRINPIETSKAYQQHVLGGIEWALGLKN
jgi:type 1 glutamine amidotransferase